MINRIVEPFLESLRKNNVTFDDNFINSEYETITDLLNYVNIPKRAMYGAYIDTSKMPLNLKELYDNIEAYCESIHSVYVVVSDYKIVQKVVCMLVEKLYRNCLITDTTLPRVLYIDTESFVSDLATILSHNTNATGISRKLSNPIDTVCDYIYSAKLIFWDRFRLDFSEYFYNYLYEILKWRYNEGLGNIYFTTKSLTDFTIRNG